MVFLLDNKVYTQCQTVEYDGYAVSVGGDDDDGNGGGMLV